MAHHIKTHTDLDAVGGRILMESGGSIISSTSYHDYSTIDDAAIQFIKKKEYKPGDTLIFIDICPSQGTCEFLNEQKPTDLNLVLLDHHKTRSWASKYPWATIDISNCGTQLVYDTCNPVVQMRYKEFVQAVAAWDLWILDSPQRQRGENLNNLLGFIGRDAFVDAFVKDPSADELPTFKEITKFLVARRDRYVRQVIKEQLESSDARLDGFGNVFKIIFATDFISEIGHAVLDHPEAEDLKYVCVVNPVTNTCSLRSRDGETDIGKIAAMCDGGGHHSAAGFPVPFKEQISIVIFDILNKLNY